MIAAGRNPWLDVCRALAISALLLGHGRLFLLTVMPALDRLRSLSFIGVELFFVLSGFLIGGILLEVAATPRRGWLRNFYQRRWWRTLPNYYLFLVINIVLVVAAVRPGDLGGLWRYTIFVQGMLGHHPTFFSEAWSLAIEEVFYFLFPLAFIAVAHLSRIPYARALVLVAVVVMAVSLLARMVVAANEPLWDDGIRKATLLRLDAIMTGVILAWLHRHRPTVLTSRPLQAASFLALAGCLLYMALADDAALNASFLAKTLLFTAAPFGCAGVILAGLGSRMPRPVVVGTGFLARISYSAYLANIPVAALLVNLWPFGNDSWPSLLAMWAAFLGLTVFVSWLIYLGYESAFLRLRDRYSADLPSRATQP
jgi:peptidoglycan/LPS O-acetylase OafA/YrhL